MNQSHQYKLANPWQIIKNLFVGKHPLMCGTQDACLTKLFQSEELHQRKDDSQGNHITQECEGTADIFMIGEER